MSLGFKQYLFLLIIWTLMISLLLTAPMPHSEAGQASHFDKLVHFCLFGFFSIMLSSLFSHRKKKIELKKIILISFIASSFYALLMELIQFFIESRTSSQYDLIFGILGIFLMQILFYERRKAK